MSSQAAQIKGALQKAVIDQNLSNRIESVALGVRADAVSGRWSSVEPGRLLYEHVTPENAPSIVDAIAGGMAEAERGDPDQPFFARQTLVVCANSGRIDPERIEDYIEAGGLPDSSITFYPKCSRAK